MLKIELFELISAHVRKEKNDIAIRKKKLLAAKKEKKTLNHKWRVKSKKEKSETSIIEDTFSLHTSGSNLSKKDFSFGSNLQSLWFI